MGAARAAGQKSSGARAAATRPPKAAADTDAEAAVAVDGRRARGERNRDAVVDAILDLIIEGNSKPSAAEIAERAGVSMRSVFRHFDDLESLYAAALDRHVERLRPLFAAPSANGSLEARVAALVEHRARLYEAMTPVRRVGIRLRDRSEALRQGLETGRRVLRDQLGDLFADELGPLEAKRRREVLDALEVVSSWESWDQLRTAQGRSVARASAALGRSVGALLATRDR